MDDNKKIMDDFISTLSHEIRTPLTSIKGFAQTLSDNYDVLDDEQKKKFLTIIRQQSERLINLVENVLNVAKIEGGADDIIFKEIDLKTLIKSTVDILKITYKTHNFETDFASNLPTSLGDFDKLQQILLNILENACKYSPSTSTVFIKAYSDGNSNVVEIKDEGAGINKDAIPKIFDKFFRAGDVLTNKVQGSGLGLYIAKNLAQKTGVEIQVESSNDKDEHWTKFSIIIPVFEVEKMTKNIKEKNV